jgi:RimJ/RimL family protein N-acetyltransferase
MEIQSQRLVLKEISWNDIEDIHNLNSFPEVSEYNLTGVPKDIDETRESVRPYIDGQSVMPRQFYNWKVLKRDSLEFIGLAGIKFSVDSFKIGDIYYKLLPSQWGQGFATEATKLIIKTGFEVLKLHKIDAGTVTENRKSIKVLEKSGMTREGLRRKFLPIRGEWRDCYQYSIIEDDVLEFRK